MDPQRKHWNQQQHALRSALLCASAQAIDLFLDQHAMVHSAQMAESTRWSFEDELWQDLTEATTRALPRTAPHSIAWLIWHMARIEDVTMNLLVAGDSQLLLQDNWLAQMNITTADTGNALDVDQRADLSARIDLAALRVYRCAVGRRTRALVQQLRPETFNQKVNPARMQRVVDEGAVGTAATDLLTYWGGLTIAGLLLMPPTRHNFVHLNEAIRVKHMVRRARSKSYNGEG